MHRTDTPKEESYRAENISDPVSIPHEACIETLNIQEYHFGIYRSIKPIAKLWDQVVPKSLFFSSRFLALIEDHPPLGLEPMYLLYFDKDNKAVGASVLQIKKIDLHASMKFDVSGNIFTKLSNGIKRFLTRFVKFDTMICGNVLLTGEYGYHFTDRTSHSDQQALLEQSLEMTSRALKKHGYRITPILMKDYYTSEAFPVPRKSGHFTEFMVQPNMIMKLNPDWNSFIDYLAELKSKYRVRVKRAFKKAADISKRELSPADLKKYNDKIYQLYLETANVASFNLFILPANYFIYLKDYLDDDVKIVGYFLGEELIGYYTIVYNNSQYMEAHYLGYDKSKNAQYQIYLNMLYDLIKEGIDCKTPKIQFARTALEIKSSIGAEAHDMHVMLRLRCSVINALLPIALKWIVPVEKWLPRQPFKE